jgi:hypothetical protein
MQLNGTSAETLVARLLARLGDVTPASRADPEAGLILSTADRRFRVHVKSLSSLSPATARRLAPPRGDVDISVVVAPRISVATSQELESAGWSWATLDNEAHITAPGLVLRSLRAERSAGSPPTSASVPLRWTNASRDIAERLLTYVPPDWPGDGPLPLPSTAAIAEETGHSQSRVAAVIRAMADRGWLRKEGGQRGVGSRWTLIDPTALLDEWVEHQQPPHEVLAHGLIGDVDTLVALRLPAALAAGDWALAGTSAAERAAPVLTANPVLEIAVAAERMAGIDETLTTLGLREVERGHRVRFTAATPVTMRTIQFVGDVPMTSTVRTYADLVNRPGRGAEAAAELRRARLAF